MTDLIEQYRQRQRELEREAREKPGRDILERLRAAQASKPKHDLSHLDDMDALMARLQAHWDAEYREYEQRYWAENPEPPPVEIIQSQSPREGTRKRRPDPARIVANLRKAGERGTIRFEMPDGTIFTSTGDVTLEPTTIAVDDAERLWLERVGKHDVAH